MPFFGGLGATMLVLDRNLCAVFNDPIALRHPVANWNATFGRHIFNVAKLSLRAKRR